MNACNPQSTPSHGDVKGNVVSSVEAPPRAGSYISCTGEYGEGGRGGNEGNLCRTFVLQKCSIKTRKRCFEREKKICLSFIAQKQNMCVEESILPGFCEDGKANSVSSREGRTEKDKHIQNVKKTENILKAFYCLTVACMRYISSIKKTQLDFFLICSSMHNQPIFDIFHLKSCWCKILDI